MSDFSGRTSAKLDVVIGNNGFFPDMQLGEFQAGWRIPADWREELIGRKVVEAIIECNRILNGMVCVWHRAGYAALVDVPCAHLGDLNELVVLYQTAVYSRAKAKLIRHFRSINRKDRQDYSLSQLAPGKGDDLDEQAMLDESDSAIRLILGDSPPQTIMACAL